MVMLKENHFSALHNGRKNIFIYLFPLLKSQPTYQLLFLNTDIHLNTASINGS